MADAVLTTTVSTKGQVILPKSVRDHRDWSAGKRLVIEETAEGVLLRRETSFPATTLDEVIGMLKYDGPAKTIEDMDVAVLQEARRRARD